jgi:NitT/TauT family transport system ATP-binding protein
VTPLELKNEHEFMTIHLAATAQQQHPEPQRPEAPSYISMKDVSLAYDGDSGSLTLNRVNMDVRQGEFVAVVGPSGCGKSTLMKLVTGLLRPTS